jgi:coenzyme F420 biosynthesis associated uncharacterized protein
MVNWSLARDVARFASGSPPGGELGVDLGDLVPAAEQHVAGYTGLQPLEMMPPPEAIDRGEWTEINLGTLADLLGPVTERLDERFAHAGPFTGPLRMAAGATLATEAGLVVGYMSQRVLGQYELSLMQPESPTRLLFIAPNLRRAIHEMNVDRDSFLMWIVLHELTHVLQFSGVSWLREHMSGLLREYLDTVEVRIEGGAAGGLPSLPNPSEIAARFREGGLAALVQTREQRDIMRRIQAAMSVIEGYSEHVMDAVGADLLPNYEGLREAMERRRRSRSAPHRVLERLLGLDLKMRQYELGKRFCDAVADRAGIEGLNRVWETPDALPSLRELEHPDAWLERVTGDSVVAA